MQLIIISGKIGAGKSTLSKCFQRKGYHYINSDMFAKELIASNDSIKKELNNQFTDLNNGNNISVNKLKQIFLSSTIAKDIINKIVHPVFFKKINMVIDHFGKDIALELPLIETINNIKSKFKVITIEAKLNIRKERYLNRNNKDIKDFMTFNRYQKSNLYYKNNSDYVISNNDTIELLYARFNKLYNQLKK